MNTLSNDMNSALLNLQQGQKSSENAALKTLRDAKELKVIDETAKEFEALFVTEMMKPMFEGIETDGLFGGGKGEEVFSGFLLQEYGKLTSQTGGLGIADMVKAAMIQMQEQANSLNKIEPGSSDELSSTTNPLTTESTHDE
jgi:Rod binding domain-containing protein